MAILAQSKGLTITITTATIMKMVGTSLMVRKNLSVW